MKRITVVVTITAVFTAVLLLVLTIAGAGAIPIQETGVDAIQLIVNIRNDYAYLTSAPNKPASITISDSSGSVKASISGTTNDAGTLASWREEWQPEQPDIMPGDKVNADVDGSKAAIDPIGNISGLANFDTDIVSGNVDAPWFSPTVDVYCFAFDDASNTDKTITVAEVDADGGSFTCDFGGVGLDLKRDTYLEIAYLEPDGDEILSEPIAPWTRVQYGHDWVGADYPAGHKFDIILQDKDGVTKATAEIMSTVGGGWGADGFETNREDWTPSDVDIIPGDTVQFIADDGYNHEVKVGTVNGDIDYDKNGAAGTILVPWLSGDLDIECHPWGAPGDWPGVVSSSAAADGSSPYECLWDPADWDLKPGQQVAVGYIEPDDNDFIMNVLVDPAPDLNIHKWVPGGSDGVSPTGPAVFRIEFENHGDAPAQTIWLTDTLPAGATYVADSSGVTPTVSNGDVMWEFDALDEHDRQGFYLIMAHSGSVGDTLTNMADIAAENDWEDHNNQAEAEVTVISGQPDVFVNKWRDSESPIPGGTFLYQIHYGNNGPVPAGPTTITDTLPDDTEVVDYYSDQNYDVWQASMDNGDFVLEAPAIPANWDDRIYLRLRVAPEVAPDTQLINEVTIETAGDSDPDNNSAEHDGTWVRDEVSDLGVEKDPRWGSLVPGGIVRYRVQIYNEGNTAVMAKLVDTLPPGTTYLETDDYEDPVIENGTVYWDMGEMLPGERQDIHFRLAIDNDVQPGAKLTNCAAAVMSGDDDNNPLNDQQCVTDRVHEKGPNLRVVKQSEWEEDDRIRYEVTVGNTGSTTINDAVVVDTYPEGTTFNGDWHADWDDVTIEHDAANREIKWTIPRMWPDQQLGIEFRVELDSNLVGEQGLTFTNLLEAPLTGDVYPQDNSFKHITYSGADLYIHKWTADPYTEPGDTVTFTVEIGNATRSHWDANDVKLEDTFPDGLKFIRATTPWDPNETWQPSEVSGDVFTWDMGHLSTGSHLQFDIVAEVEDDVKDGDLLVNQIKIYVDNEEDIDPVPENNMDTAKLLAGGPRIFLPFVAAP